ncbi:hypothetical protein FACS1894170_10840 [Planctomycetales bacterium]|nr:hypothetical protein FACS1894170_10840 [Planctomycetales bacterium]
MSRTRIVGFFSIFLLSGLVLFAQRAEEQPKPEQQTVSDVVNPGDSKLKPKPKLQREGTVMTSERVFFRQNNNRTVMYRLKDNQRFTCLENLVLERILTAMDKKPEHNVWRIDGTYTEFRGENYIFLNRAVVTGGDSGTTIGTAAEKKR